MIAIRRAVRPFLGLIVAAGLVGASPPPVPARSGFAGFVDQSGRPFDPARLAGRPVLLNFIFAGCGTTCPLQTAELVATLKGLPPALRRTVRIVSVTVDPQNDTPAALRRYAATFGVPNDRWAFLTGNRAAMLRLAATYNGAGAIAEGFAATMHSTDVLLIGSRGMLIRRYRALPLDRNRLAQDLEMLAQFPALLTR